MVGSCQACNMRFASLDEMRTHYTTDFHIANVRARVEGEAKLSAAEYRRRTMVDDDSKPIFNCKLCSKKFHSVQTLQSHVKSTEHLMRKEQRIIERDSVAGSALSSTSLGSAALGLHRRHRAHLRARAKAKEILNNDRTLAEVEAEEAEEAAARAGKKAKRAKAASSAADADDATVTATGRAKVSFEDREADVSETRCLFCGMHAKTMKANLKHMLIAHDFQLPLAERIKDARLLLQYLSRKLNGLMCLVCGESTKRFESLQALRAHMEAANHQRLVLSSEYNEFYEGTLDDGEAARIAGLEEDGSTALVVRSGTGSEAKMKRLFKRDHHVPLANKKLLGETPMQAVERRMITSQGARDTQIMLREQRQVTQKERTKHFKTMNKLYNHQKLHMLRVGMKKLWKKGYDGDGVMNLL